MDIGKKIYQELTPNQRAIAAYAAVNRNDQAEIDRLMGTASRGEGLYKALRKLGLGLEVYNLLMNRAMIGFLLENGKIGAAVSFCIGWLAAGGSKNNEEYQKNCLVANTLSSVRDNWVVEIKDTKKAAWEWCEKNQIPIDFFSGPLSPFPLPKEIGETSDSETLNAVRSVFDTITLSW